MLGSGHIPSFCTGCYRLGRVGKDFMDLAKPGLIKQHCLPNALLTFAEYLCDFADADLKASGGRLIESMLATELGDATLKQAVQQRLQSIVAGSRDLFF